MNTFLLLNLQNQMTTLLLLIICLSFLAMGVVYLTLVYLKNKDNVSLSLDFLAVIAFVFVFTEMLIFYWGGMHGLFEKSRYVHRIQQISVCFFIPLWPSFIGNLFKLTGKDLQTNKIVVYLGYLTAMMLCIFAFLLPDSFVSITKPYNSSAIADLGRGVQGSLYIIRDILLGFMVFYSVYITLKNIVQKKHLYTELIIFIALLIVIYSGLDDILYVYLEFHIDGLNSFGTSRFCIGITVFILLALAGLINDFVSKAKQNENTLGELDNRRKELAFLAYHDMSTGLPNRKSFRKECTELLKDIQAGNSNRTVGLILLECNDFKTISDHVSEEFEEKLFLEISKRVFEIKKPTDIIFKTDANEIALLIKDFESTEDITNVAMEIALHIRDAFVIGPHRFYLTPYMGISIFPKDGNDAHSLYTSAGTALKYTQKLHTSFQYFTSSLRDNTLKKLQLLHELRQALELRQFELYFQPQINQHKQMVGVEALIRWNHPELGLVLPTSFIPMVEETGLIIPLGRWIIFEACSKARLLKEADFHIPLSINLSPIQMKDLELPQIIENALFSNELSPGDIHFEITESSFIEDFDTGISLIKKLRRLGCSLSIDDFGTGYSSLNYLKTLPIQALKIDRSFVIGLPHDARDCAIVQSIVTMAQGLNLEIVAEGVDSQEQLNFLNSINCSIIQGFYYSKAIPFLDLLNFSVP